jgi:hypothetical protein
MRRRRYWCSQAICPFDSPPSPEPCGLPDRATLTPRAIHLTTALAGNAGRSVYEEAQEAFQAHVCTRPKSRPCRSDRGAVRLPEALTAGRTSRPRSPMTAMAIDGVRLTRKLSRGGPENPTGGGRGKTSASRLARPLHCYPLGLQQEARVYPSVEDAARAEKPAQWRPVSPLDCKRVANGRVSTGRYKSSPGWAADLL